MSASLNNKLRQARKLLQEGAITGALALCAEILAKTPRNPEALTLRGIAALMSGAYADAARDLRQALATAPRDGTVLEYLGLALLNLGEFAEAETLLQRASTLAGAPASVWLRLGMAMFHQGRAADAITPLRHAHKLAPDNPDCLLSLGQALATTGDRSAAVAQFETLLQFAPGHPDALFNLGVIELGTGNLSIARSHFESVLSAHPRHSDAMVNLAIVMEQQGSQASAAEQLEQALDVMPAHPHAHVNLGRLRLAAGRPADARRHFEAALKVMPALPAALEGMGAVSRAQGLHAAAAHWYERLLALDPGDALACALRADSLLQTGKLDDAETCANTALTLNPALAQPYGVLAQRNIMLGHLDAAIAILEQGIERSGNAALLGLLVHQARHTCDWDRWRTTWSALAPRITAGEDCGSPFALLCENISPAQQLAYTRRWAQQRFGAATAAAPPARDRSATGERLRIAYFSSDFQEHPAAYLVTELLELHDHSRFETFAYSYGPPSTGALRRRIIDAVDHFVDIAHEADDAVVERIRGDNIDILIDLKGYTVGDRLEIMARRPSPVQVTWLGYPGTTGTDFIDYLIADPFIIPPGEENTCSERVVRMPHCYQPTDRKRVIAESLTRAEYGLPEHGPVFCCFNQTFKITPDMFALWLRVLDAVPGSVLWLAESNRWATANLKAVAQSAGIAVERLVFAPRMPLAEHLARYRVADLALDTFPYTSHTTASDALWCGCPLVALYGDSFPARVSASILTACGLPDLVVDTLEAYERKLRELATDASALPGIRSRVAAAREHSLLFDTAAFTRDFEKKLIAMHTVANNRKA
jgi:protein O-GlcNAc transferase